MTKLRGPGPVTALPSAAPKSNRPKRTLIRPGAAYLHTLNIFKRVLSVFDNPEEMWRNANTASLNKAEASASLRLFQSLSEAKEFSFRPAQHLLEAGSSQKYADEVVDPVSFSKWTQFLDGELNEPAASDPLGKGWRFSLESNAASMPRGFESETFDDSLWDSVPVPSNWQSLGYDVPIYTNMYYPWKRSGNLSTAIPETENTVGLYRKRFVIPSEWIEAIETERRSLKLVLHGTGPGTQVFLQGFFVGYHQDSFTEATYDVTTAVALALQERKASGSTDPPSFVLALRIFRWTDGSYLEDQDHWWCSGIHRSVELRCVSNQAAIEDFAIVTDVDTKKVTNSGRTGPATLRARVCVSSYSACPAGKVVLSLFGSELGVVSGAEVSSGAAKLPTKAADAQDDVFANVPIRAESVLSDEFCSTLAGKSRDAAAQRHRKYVEANKAYHARRRYRYVSLEMSLEQVALWTAESPSLHRLVVGLEAGGEQVFEVAQVGFRRIEVINSQLCVNGRPIHVFGANRHEHDQFKGKVVTEASMIRDVAALREHNFNAVRTCHYPNTKRWYELCDMFGFFVCDEANIETHGFSFGGAMSLLQYDKNYRQAIMDRHRALVFRSRNHSSIICWSLGNEAGMGPNLAKGAAWIRQVDPTRPIQYEGGKKGGDAVLILGDGLDPVSDIVCPMYHTPRQIHDYALDPKEKRPIILCEYAHAMGNSTGNLHVYFDLFRSTRKQHRQCQGGYIWDWVDQGLVVPKEPLDGRGLGESLAGPRRVVHPTQRLREDFPQLFWMNGAWGYGGDFGKGSGDDGQFCINGLVFPDRTPHPALAEVRYLQRPVALALSEDRKAVQVQNLCDFAETSRLRLVFSVVTTTAVAHESVIAKGTLPLPEVPAGRTEAVALPAEAVRALESDFPVWLSLRVEPEEPVHGLRRETALTEERIEVRPLPPLVSEVEPSRIQCAGAEAPTVEAWKRAGTEGEVAVEEVQSGRIEVKSPRYSASFDAKSGALLSLLNAKGEPIAVAAEGADGGALLEEARVPSSEVPERKRAKKAAPVPPAPVMRHLFHRSPTDNDNGGAEDQLPWVMKNFAGMMWAYASLWKFVGLDNMEEEEENVSLLTKGGKHVLVVKGNQLSKEYQKVLFKTVTSYTFELDHIAVDVEVVAQSGVAQATTLPRVGLELVLNPALGEQVSYYGCGPHECYPDRKAAAKMGVYGTCVDDMHTPYVVPGECAGRADVRWVQLSDPKSGAGVNLSYLSNDKAAPKEWLFTDKGMALKRKAPIKPSNKRPADTKGAQLTVSRYSVEAMTKAKHQHELPELSANSPVYVRLDTAHMGVGGDVSWLPAVHEQYQIKPKGKWHYSVIITPLQ